MVSGTCAGTIAAHVLTPQASSAHSQIGAAFSADGQHFSRIPAEDSPYANTSLPWCDGCSTAGLVLWGRDAFPGLPGVADGLVADPELAVDDQGVIHAFFSSMPVDADGNVRWAEPR